MSARGLSTEPLLNDAGIKKAGGFIDRFLVHAAAQPDQVAILAEETGEATSYGELLGMIEQAKGAFEALGMGKGDVVALLLPGDKNFVSAFYALASIGATSLFVSLGNTEYEMAQRLTHAQPSLVVGCQSTLSAFRTGIEGTGSMARVLLLDSPGSEMSAPDSDWVRMTTYSGHKSPLTPPRGNPLVTLHYTYKGLGYPLGVRHSYTDYAYCLEGFERRFPVAPGDSVLSVLPLYPILGAVLLMMFPFNCGARLVIADNMRRLMSNGAVGLFETYRIAFSCVVPIIVKRMLNEALATRADGPFHFHPELLLCSGGEFLDPDIAEQVRQVMGIRILNGYGLTETTISLATPKEFGTRMGTIGSSLVRDTRVTVVDEERRQLGAGEIGEIAVTGPTVCDGYLGSPRESALFFDGRTMYTGDRGFIDEDGLLYYVDRKLPVTKISAQMVDLKEIDHILRSHPRVIDAHTVTVGRDGENYTCATVSAVGDDELTGTDLQDYCRSFLSGFKIPKTIIVRKSNG
jgi:long-chain acyl-CoA synthetase